MASKRSGKTVDEIYETLYERIISGVYTPGLRLLQQDIARELNVSRTPLREALNRLQANGFLISTSNRGMEVAAASFDETEQLYALRLLVEPPIVASVVAELTDEAMEAMEACLKQMESASYVTQNFQDVHYEFHAIALEHYPKAISEMVGSVYQKIKRHQRISFARPPVVHDFTTVDRLLLQAMRSKDAVLARQVLQFHLIDACLGLALEFDPEKMPDALVMAARGIDIDLDVTGGRIVRPINISWKDGNPGGMPSVETINLRHDAGEDHSRTADIGQTA